MRKTSFALLLVLLFISSTLFAKEKIEEINYVGLKNVSVLDIESVLPITLGDSWKPELLTLIERSVQNYYKKRGFYHSYVSVKTDYTKTGINLKLNIDEGPACIIRSFTLADPPGFTNRHELNRFKDKLHSVTNISKNDRYDEQLLTDKLRVLREWLISQDYILANTDEVQLNFNEDYSAVDVISQVNYGDRVSFGFQKNTVFTKGEFNEMITHLRATELGKDYIGVIQRKFIEEYKARAFNNVKISHQVTERKNLKHITFFFDEGVRTQIKSIQWEGLSDENQSAAKKIFETNVSRLVARGYFSEKDVEKGVQVVLEDLKSRGYLFSKLISKNIKEVKVQDLNTKDQMAPPVGKEPLGTGLKSPTYVKIIIQIFQGEQTLVGDFNFIGFSHVDINKVKELLHIEKNEAFNPFAFEDGLQKLKTLYISEGFLEFRYVTSDEEIIEFSENNRIAQIRLAVFEGPRIKVNQIFIDGLEKTREYIVRREITLQTDDWWLGTQIQQIETNLRVMGLFSLVRIRASKCSRGQEYRDMHVMLKEVDPGTFEIGPGFRSDLGLRAFSRVSYNNFFGKNWVGTLRGETNRRVNDQYRFLEYKLDATFLEPSFFGTRTAYSIGLSAKKQRFPPDFNAATTQLLTGFDRKFFEIINLKLFYKLERIRQFDVFINGVSSDVDNQTLLIGSLVPSIAIDTRDSPFTTTKGQVSSLSVEYAKPMFSGQTETDDNLAGYIRWTASSHWYLSLSKDIVWSNVFAAGFERSNIAGLPIPIIKLFRLGGYGSIRGFAEDSLNVDSISIKGTLTFLNFRTQFDLPFIGDLKFAPFLDGGNLYVDKLEGAPFFRWGTGAGLHYMTPVGPINLDYGVKLNTVGGESDSQIHFSVGFI